jgi:hypothetical protein
MIQLAVLDHSMIVEQGARNSIKESAVDAVSDQDFLLSRDRSQIHGE